MTNNISTADDILIKEIRLALVECFDESRFVIQTISDFDIDDAFFWLAYPIATVLEENCIPLEKLFLSRISVELDEIYNKVQFVIPAKNDVEIIAGISLLKDDSVVPTGSSDDEILDMMKQNGVDYTFLEFISGSLSHLIQNDDHTLCPTILNKLKDQKVTIQ